MLIGVVDIETTEFFGRGGFIVEIGMASLDTDTGEVKPLFGSVCREKGMTAKQRKAWIFENSSLTVEEVREAPDFTEIKEEIQTLISGFHAVTAFNKAFDFEFLRDRGIVIEKEWPCPMKVATDICKLPKTWRGAHYGGYKWTNVEEAWKHFFPMDVYVEEHRGPDDAAHEAKIVYELHRLGLMEGGAK